MIALLKKEILSYFNSLTVYLVVVVFLLANSLFLWVFPGNYNVMEFGYANLDGLFSIAPFVFLFLVPAVTMKLFSEENKSGTIEILLTKPLSDFNIIFAKYLAAFSLVVFFAHSNAGLLLLGVSIGVPKRQFGCRRILGLVFRLAVFRGNLHRHRCFYILAKH